MFIFGPRKPALVLGGGGARGLSNIGVLKALDRIFGGDLPFKMVIGTSIGSLIGAGYCLGYPVSHIEKKALDFKWSEIVDIGLGATGLVKGDKFENLVRQMVDGKGFEDMKIPFSLTTTDLVTGKAGVHFSGDLVKLIRASCSWPGIFSGVEIDGRVLVDGGLRNSIPAGIAGEQGSDLTLAVNPGFSIKNDAVDNVLKAVVQSVQIMGEQLNDYQSREADIVIKPDLEDVDQFDFTRTEWIIGRGESATYLQEKSILKKFRRFAR
jgi:NTE family protein